MADPNDRFDFNAWFQRNRKTVFLGGAIGLLVVAVGNAAGVGSDDGVRPQQACGGAGQPPCRDGGGPAPPGVDGSGPAGGGMNDPGGMDGGGMNDPGGMGGGGPAGGPTPSAGGGGGSGGGFDMEAWRRRQAEDDERQRERIRTIREEEKCRNRDGTYDEVSIHTGC